MQKTSLNYTIKPSQSKAENCVYLSEFQLFIELLTITIRGKPPLSLPSIYATDINRNDNQRHLIEYIWIEYSRSPYARVCENIYKNARLCYRCTKVNKYFHYILQINYSLKKHKNSIIDVWQDSVIVSVAGNNLRKSSISDV